MQGRIATAMDSSFHGISAGGFEKGRGLLKRLCIAILILSFFLGCQAQSVLVKPALEEEGELVVYVLPLQQEAQPLAFTLEAISAVKEEGGSYPLTLSLAEMRGGGLQRQRFLASGNLPPGKYAGLSFKIKNASLMGEEGPAALLVPEEPVTIGFPFHVARRKALLLSLALDYRKSVGEGYRFSPVFSIFVPDRPPIGVLGYTANSGSNNITVFDKKAGQVVGVIATGRGPSGIALDPRSRRAYVTLAEDDTIDVVDAEAWEVISNVTTPNRGSSAGTGAFAGWLDPSHRQLRFRHGERRRYRLPDRDETDPCGDGS